MATEDRYIPGVPCWVDTSQPDAEAAAAFYSALFGWEIEDVTPPGAPVKYFAARLRGGGVAGISSLPEGAPGPATWNTYVWVTDAEQTAAKVYEARGTILSPPMEVGEAGRRAIFADPDGAEFRVWEPRRHRGATVVNEHGSVNFNNL